MSRRGIVKVESIHGGTKNLRGWVSTGELKGTTETVVSVIQPNESEYIIPFDRVMEIQYTEEPKDKNDEKEVDQ